MANYKVAVNSTTGKVGPYPVLPQEDPAPAPTGYQYVNLVEGTPAYDILAQVEGAEHPNIDIYSSSYIFAEGIWDYTENRCPITWNQVITCRNSLLSQSDKYYVAAKYHEVPYAEKMWRDYRAHLRVLFQNVDFQNDDPCDFVFPEGPTEIEAMSELIQSGSSEMRVIADGKLRRGDVWYTEMYQRLGISTTGVQ